MVSDAVNRRTYWDQECTMSFLVLEKHINYCVSRGIMPCWACGEISEGMLWQPCLFTTQAEVKLLLLLLLFMEKTVQLCACQSGSFWLNTWCMYTHATIRWLYSASMWTVKLESQITEEFIGSRKFCTGKHSRSVLEKLHMTHWFK